MRNVAVLGPGGVGGLLGALLAREGATVTCLAGPSTVAVLNRDGIRVESGLFGDFTVPVRAAERLADPIDVVLVTVKATQLDDALDRLPADVVGSALAERIVAPYEIEFVLFNGTTSHAHPRGLEATWTTS